MKKITFIFIIVISLCSQLSSQWIHQLSTNNEFPFVSIKFGNSNTGYLLSSKTTKYDTNSFIYKTTNGGNNWVTLSVPQYMNMFLLGLDFINAYTGYVIGWNYWLSINNHIFKTTDGGVTWSDIEGPQISCYTIHTAIKFFNEQTGYLAGRYGIFGKTTNGGLNWFTFDTVYSDIKDIFFINDNTGFFTCSNSKVYKTTDGGATITFNILSDTTPAHFNYGLNKIKFANSLTGYITSDRINPYQSAIFKTTNGGISWKSILVLPEYWYAKALELTNDSTIYVGLEGGEIIKSTNCGWTWISMILPSTNFGQNFICFLNKNTGFSNVAERLYRTTNSGVFINNISVETPSGFELFQNYPNPFNSTTIIKYNVPKSALITLKIFDILGREIYILVNERQKAGTYEAGYKLFNLSSGIYLYSLYSDGEIKDTKKFIVSK
ncbi:MAG: T9SS type A sorting domain-containing protein [Ignavibacteriae bacterium]|nr:T9SS type A sorting domain-containing protein [Ignavibacteriota bacterium]